MSETAPVSEAEQAAPDEKREKQRDEGQATVALVCGIAALFLAWIPILSMVIGFVAIGFGLTRVRSRSRRVAILGIALGVVAIGLNVAATIVVFG
jgi:hypothetical protein